jgi:diguanylate cyclase (GGDEF)-like protein
VLAHALALSGMTLYVHALRQFHGLPFRALLLAPALLGSSAIAAVTLLDLGLAWRIVCTSLTFAVLLIAGLHTLSGANPLAPRISSRVLRIAFLVLTVAVSLRAVQAGLHPPQGAVLIDITRGPFIAQLLLMSALPVVGTSVFFAMCSERMRLRWEAAAATDFLTGLANRRSLVDGASAAIREAHTAARPLALAMIDIDHFKQINDRYGHAAGDAALRLFADRLRGVCAADDLPARTGGEEFCVLGRGRNADDLGRLVGELRQALQQQPLQWQAQTLRFTFSAGIAALSAGEDGLDDLLGRADLALYAAKHHGRDRIELTATLVQTDADEEEGAT